MTNRNVLEIDFLWDVPGDYTGIATRKPASPNAVVFCFKKYHYKNGVWHRLDGPATEYSREEEKQYNEYWIEGKFIATAANISLESFFLYVNLMKLKGMINE